MRQNLSSLLNGGDPCRLAGVYDAITCRLAEEAGFDGIWASGLCIAAAHGVPDTEAMTVDAYLSALRVLRRATSLPILADCNAGFGDAHAVVHLVRQAESLGIDGICLEDKAYPRCNSLLDSKRPSQEIPARFAVKIRAACEYRKSAGLLVIARIESLVAGQSVAEALERAHLYRQAGADGILIHSKATLPDEVFEFAQGWQSAAPLLVVPTTYPSLSIAAAKAHGIVALIYANQVLRAVIPAARAFLDHAATADRLSDCRDRLASVADIFSIQGMDRHDCDSMRFCEWERSYGETASGLMSTH